MENLMIYLFVLVIVLAIVYLYVLKGKSSSNAKKSVERFEGGGFVLGNEEIQIEAGQPVVSGGDGVPSGTIVAYNGANVPEGWAICDGSNGTPNLKGRFILGSVSKDKIGKTGGEEEVSLSNDEMPPHDHYFYAHKNSKRANLNYNMDYKLSPIKWIKDNIMASGAGDATLMASSPSGGLVNNNKLYNLTNKIKNNPEQIDINENRYKDAYDVKPHNNMPPYYVLFYIMKL